MRVNLGLSDGRSLYTELDLGGDTREPLMTLQAIFDDNPGSWLGCTKGRDLKSGPVLVNTAQVVTAELDD